MGKQGLSQGLALPQRPGLAETRPGAESWCRDLVPGPVLVPWGNHGLEEAGQPVLTSDGRLLGFLLYFHLLGS